MIAQLNGNLISSFTEIIQKKNGHDNVEEATAGRRSVKNVDIITGGGGVAHILASCHSLCSADKHFIMAHGTVRFLLFAASQRCCGKVMFSVTFVCQSLCPLGDPHVTITHDALDLSIQGPHGLDTLYTRTSWP